MTDNDMARLIAASIARHQTRGLTYGDATTEDVVIHGHIDMRAVAADVIAQMATTFALPSWAPWFGRAVHRRRGQAAEQARLDAAAADVEAAIERLRLRAEAEAAGPA